MGILLFGWWWAVKVKYCPEGRGDVGTVLPGRSII